MLGKYKTGGMLRRNAEWRDHVFKITEGKLQYHDLNDVSGIAITTSYYQYVCCFCIIIVYSGTSLFHTHKLMWPN